MDARKYLGGAICLVACLFCAGDIYAENSDKQPPIKRGTEHVGSIFDDQADEFEEPTYTPPADIEQKIKSIPPIPSNILKHLQDKYSHIRKDDLSSTLQQTENGPLGYIHIRGDITPKTGWESANVSGVSREERAMAMAKAFIEQEKPLLGITNFEELHDRIHISEGYGGDYIHIYYQRKIGDLELKNATIHVTVGPHDTIIGVSAEAVAPPPALYQAAAKKTLGRGKIFRIIRQDLKMPEDGTSSVGVSGGQKVAIPKPPYVIWKVGTMEWDYEIDAFTGEILKKISTRRTFVAPRVNNGK